VIEDNKADVFLVEEAIAAYKIHAQLEVITDGEEAMRRLDQNKANAGGWPPDLFILDLNLPKRSGSEILARIRQELECAHIPVLVMTSSDSDKDRQQTTRLGCSGYFRKPSGFDEFLKIGAVIKLLLAATF
jgi:two-component system, chemotaxis family, response regulator Rcp1